VSAVRTALPDAALDLPHGLFGDPLTVENYQWLAMDSSGLGLLCHAGTYPGDGTLWHTLSAVSLPNGAVYVAKAVGRAPDPACAGTALHHLRCEGPFSRWRFCADAGFQPTTLAELGTGPLPDRPTVPLTVDVAFDAFGPLWNPKGSGAQPEWGSFHLEQPMRARGRVSIGGTVHRFDGYGFRDHSRGHRDLRNVEHSYWCNGVFPSGRTFASLQVTNLDGHCESRAAILDGTEFTDATLLVPPALSDPFHEPFDLTVTLRDGEGTEHRISGRVRGGATWSIVGGSEFCLGAAVGRPDAYLLPQSIVAWEWDGETGYGLADRCGRIDYLLGGEGARR
jgi:hypothetical protein